MGKDRIYHIGPVEVTKHRVDWANAGPDFYDLADATLARVTAIPEDSTDHRYLNPGFTLRAPATVPEDVFLRQAYRACIIWNKQIARVLGNRARRRAAKNAANLERMMAFSGFLMISGKHVHTKTLNRVEALSQ